VVCDDASDSSPLPARAGVVVDEARDADVESENSPSFLPAVFVLPSTVETESCRESRDHVL
jgi:hypothetical protein